MHNIIHIFAYLSLKLAMASNGRMFWH